MRRLLLLPLLTVWLGLVSCQSPQRSAGDGPLIVISLDGFRWDYLDKHPAPTLRRLAAAGVHARRLTPSYPARTFPNHYTLVTGLRPEHHGIVNNQFHDPALGADFGKTSTAPAWWNGGEPVWVTAESQGRRAATYMWPGGEAEIRGRRPSEHIPFSKTPTESERVDAVLAWLARPVTERPRLCLLYFDAVDIMGHNHGPEAPETAAAVQQVDAALARLLTGLEKLGLGDTTNLVVVSDHGLAETSPERVVFFDDLLDLSLVTVEANGPHGGVRPKPGVNAAALVAAIRAKAPPQVQVYLREELPARLHYRASERIPPILFVLQPGWCIEARTGWAMFKAFYNRGNHGWDPATPKMGALFIAHGPAFRRQVTLANAENVDVYNLLCAVLGLTPAANDGGDTLARAALRR
ncbi:ectonucleotide pyrophosphatase/phosphodiesterase [Oleiharenicola lentus]|nr:ectonucleotide pyrophosphatase/phosphodiesterase [Oleiharenicola lentus]